MFLSLTTITGIIVGIITLNVSEKAHLMISIIGFVSSLPGWLLFGLSLYKDYMYSGLLMMTSGVILIPFLMTVGAKTKELVGNYESLFFFAAYLTNIVIYVTYFAH